MKEVYNLLSLDNLLKYVKLHFFNVILAILLVIFFNQIANIFHKILCKVNSKILKEKAVRTFFNSLSNIVIKLVLLTIILQLVGINLSSIFALVGALGLVLGFAFKETISNICGGVILLTFKPFKVGDLISYNSNIGTIKKIEIFYTTILTLQNEYLIIPNGNLINNEIKNIDINNIRRLDLKVGVSYESDIQKVKNLILSIINREKEKLFDYTISEPIIGVVDLNSSSIDFDIKVYVKKGKYQEARYYILENIKKVFDENNIEIPYNKLDVYMK